MSPPRSAGRTLISLRVERLAPRYAAVVGDQSSSPTKTGSDPKHVGATAVLPDDWARDATVLTTAVRDLVKNMDTIASFTIPFARLPRRFSRYADQFAQWGDVADQTPRSLLQLPRLGEAAVAAVIEGAAEAVRTTHEVKTRGPMGAGPATALMVGRLDQYDRAVLADRVWALRRGPLQAIADQLGVDPSSVTRGVPAALARLRELLTDPIHEEVLTHVETLRRRIGPLVTPDALDVEFCRLGVEPGSSTAELLLYVAGPYALRGTWIEVLTVDGGGHQMIQATIDGVFAEHPAPTTAKLLDALTAQGMLPGLALTYLREETPLRCFGDLWVPWSETGIGNWAEAILHVLGAPATVETLDRALRSAGATAISSLSRVISVDKRFIRTSRVNWGLRAWGLPEYTSLSDAIGQRIDAAGGEARTGDIIRDVLATFPDVAETSIRAYLGTLAFIVEDGVARRRTEADPWPAVKPLHSARSGYLNGRSEVRHAIPVNHDLLRGSGQYLPAPVSAAVGVGPRQRRTFTSTTGQLTLYWDLDSTTGPHIGSLRKQAEAVNAVDGDDLILALRTLDDTFEVIRAVKDEPASVRLRKLLGRNTKKPVAALAAGLGCAPERVAEILRDRGEHAILELIKETSADG